MSKIIQKIEALNRRGKRIELFATRTDKQQDWRTFAGYSSDELHPLHSITKPITCLMVLLLADELAMPLEAPLLSHVSAQAADTGYYQLTVEQFANMTTGMNWREIDVVSQTGSQFEQFVQAEDALSFILAQTLSGDEHFAYNTASSHALVYWAEAVTGQSFEALVKAKLFRPLGITNYSWQRDRQGRVYGGHGLSLSGLDFIKLMEVFSTGRHAGKRVIAPRIIHKLQRPVVHAADKFRGYGYGLWHGNIKKAPFIGAYGRWGQRIYYFPTRNRCYAFLGQTTPEFGIHESLLSYVV